MKTSYITTPIYYVNDKPHIGHWYTSIMTDILHRADNLLGYDARMQTGTDEHGQKIQKSADAKGVNAMQFCNTVSSEFRKMTVFANCSCSYPVFNSSTFNQFNEVQSLFLEDSNTLFNNGENFIRTTEGRDLSTGNITPESFNKGRHVKFVTDFWNRLHDNGWLYKSKYSGWYAVRDEAFYQEKELINGKAPTGAEVEWREEECYFFRLSCLQNVLLALYKNNPDFIRPFEKYTEVASFVAGAKFTDLKKGIHVDGALNDLCVSRPGLKWGIPVPNEDNQVIYVWLDALLNYVSALGTDLEKFWNNRTSGSKIVHIVGKDILRFHCVYWPAFLIAGKVSYAETSRILESEDDLTSFIQQYQNLLPDTVYAHGWWTNMGEKISKSLGNTIDPHEEIDLIKQHGVQADVATDYFRYFMAKAMPFGNDGDFSRGAFGGAVHADIVNNIGNLVQRTASMISKYLGGKITFDIRYAEISDAAKKYEQFDILSVINIALEGARAGNELIDRTKPWQLAKEFKVEEIANALSQVCSKIVTSIALLQPVCPAISSKMLKIFGFNEAIVFTRTDVVKHIAAVEVPEIFCHRLE